MSTMTAAQAAQQHNRTGDGRYAEQFRSDPGVLDLDEPGQVVAELLGILAGNLRHPVGYLRRFRGGDAAELADVARILGDTDRYDDLPVHVETDDGQCVLHVECDDGLILTRRLSPPDGGASGLDAALGYAAEADATLKLMAADVARIGARSTVHEAPRVAPPLAADGFRSRFTWEGVVFRRLPEVDADTYYLAFQADRPLTDAEVEHFAHVAGYGWRAEVRGESLGHPVRVDESTFVVLADSTKSRSDDVGEAMARFAGALPTLVSEGTPVRKTDRAGAGTAGTRAIDGMGDLRFAVFAG